MSELEDVKGRFRALVEAVDRFVEDAPACSAESEGRSASCDCQPARCRWRDAYRDEQRRLRMIIREIRRETL